MQNNTHIRLYIFVILVLCTIGLSAYTKTNAATTIDVNNPFFTSLTFTLKCGWDAKRDEFDHIVKYRLQARKITRFTVPHDYSNCQIWPE